MATVFDYLEKLKQENPEYRRLDNVSLYNKLRDDDENLPSWGVIDNPSSSITVSLASLNLLSFLILALFLL